MGLPLTIVNGLIKDFAVNLSSSQIDMIDSKALRQYFSRSGPDISNHDLYKALKESIKMALQQCAMDYRQWRGKEMSKAHYKAIDKRISTLQQAVDERFDDVFGSSITDDAIISFQKEPNAQLQQAFSDFLNLEELATHGKTFLPFLQENFPPNILRAFTEILKENKRAWIAYQRLTLDDLRESSLITQLSITGMEQKLTTLTTQFTAYQTILDAGTPQDLADSVLAGFSELQQLFNDNDKRLDELDRRLVENQTRLFDRFDRLEDQLARIAQLGGEGSSNAISEQRLLNEIQTAYLDWGKKHFASIRLPAVAAQTTNLTIPLERVYVALQLISSEDEQAFRFGHQLLQQKLEEATQQQAEQAQRNTEDLLADVLRQNATTGSFHRGNSPHSGTEVISIDCLFNQQQKLLILGNPGSGKTTLLRWLALQLFSQFDREQVVVPRQNILGRFSEEDDQTMLPLGPARLPVFIRISEYADFFEHRDVNRGIIDYCGYHLPQLPELDQEAAHQLIRYYLKKQNAVIFLDGMDEVVQHRELIIQQIETFMANWIPQEGIPGHDGGNQIIITSRHVGYHVSPLRTPIRKVFVRDMDDTAIRNFCDLWIRQVFNDRLATLPKPEREESIKQKISEFTSAIFDPNNPRVRALAANPMMVTIIGLLYQHKGGNLPRSRVALYENSISVLVSKWEKIHQGTKGITPTELDILLENTAAWIHASPSEEITERELRELVEDGLRQQRGVPEQAPTPGEIRNQAARFIRIVRHDVGLLSEVGDHLYRFIHRSFQEFLAARFLVSDRRTAANRVLEHLSDPVWREPVTMAIGYANRNWTAPTFNDFLQRILEAESELEALLPRGIILVAGALPDMESLPRETFKNLVYRFLDVIGKRSDNETITLMRQAVAGIINELRQGERKEEFYAICLDLLEEETYTNAHWAVLSLADTDNWYLPEWIPLIFPKIASDSAEWDWPIDRILRRCFSGNEQIEASRYLVFRRHLFERPELYQEVLKRPDWQKLILLLYGATPYYPEVNAYQDLYRENYRFLSKRAGTINPEVFRAEFMEKEAPLKFLEEQIPVFSVEHIHRDSPYSLTFLKAIQKGQEPTQLVDTLLNQWNKHQNPDAAAIALLACTVLGVNIEAEIVKAQQTSGSGQKIKRFFDHLQRVKQSLLPATVFWNKLTHDHALLKDYGFKNINVKEGNHTYRAVLLTLNELFVPGHCRFVSEDFDPLHNNQLKLLFGSERPHLLRREADALAYFNIGHNDDPVYSLAVVLDTLGKKLAANNGQHLLDILNQLPETAGLNATNSFNWRAPDFLFHPTDERDRVVRALLILHHLPFSFQMLREFAVTVMWDLLSHHPGAQDFALSAFLADTHGSEVYRRINELWGSGHPLIQAQFRIPNIPDPFFRFLTVHFINKAIGVTVNLKELAKAYEDIERSTEKATALLFACATTNPEISIESDRGVLVGDKQKNVFREKLRDFSATAIPLPANQALFSLYRSLFFPAEGDQEMVHLAMNTIPAIADDEQKAIVLKTIKKLSPVAADAYPHWPTVNTAFSDTLAFNRGMGKEYRTLQLVANYFGKDEEPQTAANYRTPAIAIAHQLMVWELNQRFGIRDRLAALIDNVMQGREVNESLLQILDYCRDGHPISYRFIQLIDYLTDNYQVAAARRILCLLDPNPTVSLSLIEHWKESFVDELVSYFYLMAAELGYLSVTGVNRLLEVMTNYSDRWRYRAIVSLIGNNPTVENQKRKFRASELGLELLQHITNVKNDLKSEQLHLSMVFTHFGSNLIFDDERIIVKACREAPNFPELKDAYRYYSFLTFTDSITPLVFHTTCGLIKKLPTNQGRHLCTILSRHIYLMEEEATLPAYLESEKIGPFLDLLSVRKAVQAHFEMDYYYRAQSFISALLDVNSTEIDYAAFQKEVMDHLESKRFVNQVDILEVDHQKIYKLLVADGKNLYHRTSEDDTTVKSFCDAFNPSKHDIRKIVKLCFTLLREDHAKERFHHARCALLLAALAENYRELWLVSINNEPLQETVATLLHTRHFLLRGYLLRITASVLTLNRAILTSCLNALDDDPNNRQAAINVFRQTTNSIDTNALIKMISMVKRGKGFQSQQIIQLLSRSATQSEFKPQLRKKVINQLTDLLLQQINNPADRAFLYRRTTIGDFDLAASDTSIHYHDSLQNVLYRELFKLTGI
jgi:energy-coupling factor transporter ATP-binding protein EcfA2